MLSHCFLNFSVGVGAFVIGLSQISSFFSLIKSPSLCHSGELVTNDTIAVVTTNNDPIENRPRSFFYVEK